LISLIEEIEQKSYVQDVPNIHHVHPFPNVSPPGDTGLSTDLISALSATIGGGFVGCFLLGFALKKIV
jgi:hypothetical protein